jgi:hypothetical protein
MRTARCSLCASGLVVCRADGGQNLPHPVEQHECFLPGQHTAAHYLPHLPRVLLVKCMRLDEAAVEPGDPGAQAGEDQSTRLLNEAATLAADLVHEPKKAPSDQADLPTMLSGRVSNALRKAAIASLRVTTRPSSILLRSVSFRNQRHSTCASCG